jgi:hypothetical protein
MRSPVRFGKRTPVPSTLQIRHELRTFIAEENVRELCAEGKGLASDASWDEIVAHRAQAAPEPPV